MNTGCNPNSYEFQSLSKREVVGAFDGGKITSDAGGLLLREVENHTGILKQFSECFIDYRDPDLIEHTVEELGAQVRISVRRVFLSMASGWPYQDLFDQDYMNLKQLIPRRC